MSKNDLFQGGLNVINETSSFDVRLFKSTELFRTSEGSLHRSIKRLKTMN